MGSSRSDAHTLPKTSLSSSLGQDPFEHGRGIMIPRPKADNPSFMKSTRHVDEEKCPKVCVGLSLIINRSVVTVP